MINSSEVNLYRTDTAMNTDQKRMIEYYGEMNHRFINNLKVKT